MSQGVTIHADTVELEAVARALGEMAGASSEELLADLAQVGESMTQERILRGGPAPDGSAWAPRAIPSGKRLLNQQGGLSDSVEGRAAGDAAEWGSHLIYSRIHQLGGVISGRPRLAVPVPGGLRMPRRVEIPARPYLGIGPEEREALIDVAEAWMEGAA